MKIVFAFRDGTKKVSPSFEVPITEDIDFFWDDYLGSEASDSDLFWNSDASGVDPIVVDWFANPVDPDVTIAGIAQALRTNIAPYSQWD